MRFDTVICLLFVFVILCNCGRESQKGMTEAEYESTREALVGANRILVQKDYERIKSFAERKGWVMNETPSGLWYQIYEHGSGQSAEKGQLITLEYTVALLDETVIYNSDSLGLKRFRIGSGGVETGLEEGVLLLREGDKARFIIPPHLAHGLTGDGNKIPSRSIILYDVTVVDLDTQTVGI